MKASFDWKVAVPSDGLFAQYYAQAINKNAPHPAAARLWQEFLYSDEGQNLWLAGQGAPGAAERDAAGGHGRQGGPRRAARRCTGEPQFPTQAQTDAAQQAVAKGWAARHRVEPCRDEPARARRPRRPEKVRAPRSWRALARPRAVRALPAGLPRRPAVLRDQRGAVGPGRAAHAGEPRRHRSRSRSTSPRSGQPGDLRWSRPWSARCSARSSRRRCSPAARRARCAGSCRRRPVCWPTSAACRWRSRSSPRWARPGSPRSPLRGVGHRPLRRGVPHRLAHRPRARPTSTSRSR